MALAFNAVIVYNAGMPQSETPMATLTIRNVDSAVKEQLRVRAARHGRSMEAELRSILTDAVESDRDSAPNLADAIRRRFAPLGGVELESHPPVTPGAPPAFDP
jgi:plasmid stability protein